MAERILRWGILGTARINRALIPPLRISPRNTLLAAASRSKERAQSYVLEWDIPRAYGSYEALLADPEVDVVYISLPNALHAPWVIRAAQAGKHILCEKPLGLNVQEVDDMRDAARQAGVILAEAFMYRHHPQTLRVKQLIEAGRIGEIHLVSGAFNFFLDRPGDVRLDPVLGGGSIWDIGCYPISYARYLVGRDPEEVFGRQVRGSSGVDVNFAGQMWFPGDIIAQFDSSFRSPFRTYMEVVGSRGSIYVPNPFKPGKSETILLRTGEETQQIEITGDELYLGEVEDMADAVLLGKPPRISLADSRGNTAAIISFLESAEQGIPIRLGL